MQPLVCIVSCVNAGFGGKAHGAHAIGKMQGAWSKSIPSSSAILTIATQTSSHVSPSCAHMMTSLRNPRNLGIERARVSRWMLLCRDAGAPPVSRLFEHRLHLRPLRCHSSESARWWSHRSELTSTTNRNSQSLACRVRIAPPTISPLCCLRRRTGSMVYPTYERTLSVTVLERKQ